MKRSLVIAMMLLLPQAAHAQIGNQTANPVVMVIVLGTLALAPFVLIMFTSFVKISVVLSILRNALGTQQVPPNQIITGLAFVLSIFVMVPVGRQMYADAGDVANTRDIFSEASVKSLFDASKKAKEPLRRFLGQHSNVKDRELFMDLAMRLERSAQAQRAQSSPRVEARPAAQGVAQQPPATNPRTRQVSFVPAAEASPPAPQATPTPGPPQAPAIKVERPDKNDFQVLMPAFVTSQLKEAFEVGFLLFIPFIVVDMVVANILLAMGMQMLSPTVISLPFKLLLFVLVDGWFLIVRGLVLSYV
jgi:flagellar biosynthesis protein FliP